MSSPTASSRRPSVLIGQSGGATAVINASLIGVVDAALESGGYDRILGMRNGIEGLLAESFVDLGTQPRTTLDGIRETPSSALGTGRYKLKADDLDRALDLLATHGITALVYIGGNDSADTAHRLATHAADRKQALQVIHVPKTVDNDLPETDYCPGYPSLAKALANTVRDATYDTLAAPALYPVKFIEVMGRDAGWVAAAGALAFSDDERAEGLAPRILLPEHPPASSAEILDLVRDDLATRGWTVVVVPETLRDAAGQHFGGNEPEYVDAFGHAYYPSAGAALARIVTQELGVRARFEKPGSALRMSRSLASAVDLADAYQLGREAIARIHAGESARMVALRRVQDDPYQTEIVSVPVEHVANRVRTLPEEFIAQGTADVTAAYHSWARPLLGPDPFPRYARFADETRS